MPWGIAQRQQKNVVPWKMEPIKFVKVLFALLVQTHVQESLMRVLAPMVVMIGVVVLVHLVRHRQPLLQHPYLLQHPWGQPLLWHQ